MHPSIHLVAAARPNFMKVAPLYHRLKAENWCSPVFVHTGQHYDTAMSQAFFDDLRLPSPDFHLGIGSGSHAAQTGGVMIAYEDLCRRERPDWTIVVGDVNSTMACALAAVKLHIPVAHLEAGLRSRDRAMPEEINRIVTDAVADRLWTPSPDADENLTREGIPESRIERVGNIMIDAYEMLRPEIERVASSAAYGLADKDYAVVTLHRPSNVDEAESLSAVVDMLVDAAAEVALVFPLHPRTAQALQRFGLHGRLEKAGIRLLPPLGYIDFQALVRSARAVVTDSGGIQEETTYLGIPCLTLRATTERPITVSEGTNRLVDVAQVPAVLRTVLSARRTGHHPPALWDGKTAARVSADLRRLCATDAQVSRRATAKRELQA